MCPNKFVYWAYTSQHDVNNFMNISKLFDEQVYLFVLREDDKVEWLTPIRFEPFVRKDDDDYNWIVEVDINDMDYGDCTLCDIMGALFGITLIGLFVYLLLAK